MDTITLTRRDAQHSLDSLRRIADRTDNVYGLALCWAQLLSYFDREPAAVSVNVEAAFWGALIAETGDAIAASLAR